MIEIVLGIFTVAAATALLLGVGGTLGPLAGTVTGLLGAGGAIALATAGVILILHGLYRRQLRRHPDSRLALRRIGSVTALASLVALVGCLLPLFAQALNLATVGGFPLGFYLAAQGAPVLMVMLAFIHAAKQDAIDAAEPAERG